MRRLLLLLVSCLTLAGLYAVGAPASAADPLTGTLVDSGNTDAPISGATVRLRTVTPGGPGAVVVTDVTDGDGDFSLDAGATPAAEYYVEVLHDDYQSGYVGGAPGELNYVQVDVASARPYGPHAHLGNVLAIPSYIRGIVVNNVTGNRVRGIKVSARSATDISQPIGSDITNARGVFRINGIQCEDDCFLRFIGHPRDYENGFRACPGTVVPTWGEACGSPLGRIYLDHL